MTFLDNAPGRVVGGNRLGVIGLGRVGLVWAAVLAEAGFHVIGVDLDEAKVRLVSSGKAPFHEPGLDELVSRVVGEGLLEATTSYEKLREADTVFIMVGTPPGPGGAADLRYVEDAARGLGRVWRGARGYRLVVVRSTVPPGTTRGVVGRIVESESGLRLGEELGLAMNPEFVSEGTAVEDSRRPSRIVIGALDERSAEKLLSIYRVLSRGRLPPVVVTSIENAELAKYANNLMLAARLSIVNALALIAEKTPNADIDTVAHILGLDPRIGSAYLRAGLGYGGSCLPKDVDALRAYASSLELGVVASLLEAVQKLNEYMHVHAANLLAEALGGLAGKRIAILGIAFKPGTDDTRESKSLKLALLLRERGASVVLHDPMEGARRDAARLGLAVVESLEDALRGADAAVVATPWREYVALHPRRFRELMKGSVVLDPWRVYDRSAFEREGLLLLQLGVSRVSG